MYGEYPTGVMTKIESPDVTSSRMISQALVKQRKILNFMSYKNLTKLHNLLARLENLKSHPKITQDSSSDLPSSAWDGTTW